MHRHPPPSHQSSFEALTVDVTLTPQVLVAELVKEKEEREKTRLAEVEAARVPEGETLAQKLQREKDERKRAALERSAQRQAAGAFEERRRANEEAAKKGAASTGPLSSRFGVVDRFGIVQSDEAPGAEAAPVAASGGGTVAPEPSEPTLETVAEPRSALHRDTSGPDEEDMRVMAGLMPPLPPTDDGDV